MLICLMAQVSLACTCWWGVLVGRAKSARRSCSTGPEPKKGASVGRCNHGVAFMGTNIAEKQMADEAKSSSWCLDSW